MFHNGRSSQKHGPYRHFPAAVMTVCRATLEFAPSARYSKGGPFHSVKQLRVIILGQLFAERFLSVLRGFEIRLVFRCADSVMLTFGLCV